MQRTITAPSPCLTAALDYLARGWSALALCPPDHEGMHPAHKENCDSPGKRPPWPWKTYQDRLPSERELKIYFARARGCNVGIALGPVSGLIGLDVDGPGGEAALQELSQGDLPETLEFSTGRPDGGRRLLYRIPEGVTLPTMPFRSEDKEPLRILSYGSQTVMPPSRHHSGAEYHWHVGHRPGEIEAAFAPQWVLDLALGKSRPRAQPAAPRTVVEGAPIPEGQRDVTLTRCAGSLRRQGATADEIFQALLLMNQRCEPPLGEADLHKIARSMMNYPPHTERNGSGVARPAKPLPKVNIYSAADLAARDYPDIRWAVPGILPEGVTILAGRPKVGKSWLVLNLALGVASGGGALGQIGVQPGRVLYLALEDGPRRLKKRLAKVLAAQHGIPPASLELTTTWARHSDGGLYNLAEWIDGHRDARLIIVDTLARVRDRRTAHGGL